MRKSAPISRENNKSPEQFCSGLLLFSKMLMGIYMIYAEAMVACAAGAITKFKIRMIGIGASANLAAAGIGLYLFLGVYALNLPLEVDGSLALAASAGADIREKLIAAEKQEVENSHDGEEIDGEGESDNIRKENYGIHYCQPLHLYGYYKEQKNLQIGEKGGKREEH